jgi:DNA-binding beta-propeller fold protein YncE
MVRWPLLVLVGCTGTVPTTDAGVTIDAAGPCPLPTLAQTVATLAGCSQAGTDDGMRGDARLANPTNVAIAPGGIAYVTDFDTSRVRAIDATGATSTVYLAANFQAPFGIALAPGGKLYVETDDNDMGGHSLETGTVWRIDPVTRTAEVIARDLGRPRGLAVLPDGRIAMADHQHHTISILDPSTGAATLLAGVRDVKGYANGVGTGALFAQPYDIVVHPDGSLIVSDMENHRVRHVFLDGTVEDFAGSGENGALNGPVAVATFDAPQALAILPTGVVFVTDIHRKIVRRIAAGNVSTIAGDGTPGWIDATAPRNARFYGLEGMDVDASRLVVADGNVGDGMPYNRVRVVQLSGL